MHSNTENTPADEINNLLELLRPEINDFRKLIEDMAVINSPYKNEFNYMRVLVHHDKFIKDLEGKINLLIDELNQFGKIYEKIVEDDDACELYVKSGLLDKSVDLQKRIMSKIT